MKIRKKPDPIQFDLDKKEKSRFWDFSRLAIGRETAGDEQEKAFLEPERELAVRSVAPPTAEGEGVSLLRRKTGETYCSQRDSIQIGKSPEGDVVVSGNPAISRRHAEIRRLDGGYCILDLGSTNHTYVNGIMVAQGTQVPLEKGDIIRLANEEFEFTCE